MLRFLSDAMALAMFARFLMALLIALLPLPAVAMPVCHEVAPVAADMGVSAHHGGHSAPQKQQPEARMMACIGCIPPGTVHPPVASPSPLAKPRLLVDRSTDGAPLAAPKPATPPPRSDA